MRAGEAKGCRRTHSQHSSAEHHPRISPPTRPPLLVWLLASILSSCILVAQAGESHHIPAFSFDKGAVNCVPQAPNFTYVVSSDAQLWWWTLDQRNEASMGELTNRAQLDLWRSASQLRWPDGTPIDQPSGLVINGDLTTFGLDYEWRQYRAMFDTPDMPFPVFPGLGNHDYTNNMHSCWDGGVDPTTCARRSLTTLRLTVAGKDITSSMLKFFARLQGPLASDLHSHVNAFDWGSASYSWDAGNYHFIMMHFHPAFTTDLGSYNLAGPVVVTPGYTFLEKELNKAQLTGRKAVLFIHDVDEHWVAVNDTRFLNMLSGRPVVGVFCGHWHWLWGKVTTLNTTAGQAIPVFRSGSSEYQTSLMVQFSEPGLRMQVVSSLASDNGTFKGPLSDYYYEVDASAYKCTKPPGTPAPVLSCPSGWTLDDGGVCWAPCPEGYHVANKRCIRYSCGAFMERNGLLCYPPCEEGYAGAGPMCWKDCPAGFKPLMFMCLKTSCGEGYSQDGGKCYAECDTGYEPLGRACRQTCPEDYTDEGELCRRFDHMFGKMSYKRASSPKTQLHLRGGMWRTAGFPMGAAIDRDWFTLPVAQPLTSEGEHPATKEGKHLDTQEGGNATASESSYPATRKGGDSNTKKGGNSNTKKGGNSNTKKGGNSNTRKAGNSSTKKGGDPATKKGGNSTKNKGGNPVTKKGSHPSRYPVPHTKP